MGGIHEIPSMERARLDPVSCLALQDIQAKDDDNKRSVHSFKSDTKPAKGAQEGPKQAKSAEAKAPAAKEAERAAPPQKEASPHRDEVSMVFRGRVALRHACEGGA